MRRYYDWELNFMQTSAGKHVLLWQASELNWDATHWGPHGHELRFVTNPYSLIASQMNSTSAGAEVNITNIGEKKKLHYVFAPEGSAAATTWKAKGLGYSTASSLASRVDDDTKVSWSQVKRITYELQDLADIFPTHWQHNAWYLHWLPDTQVNVLLESPIINEAGVAEVSTGLQSFYARSRDSGKSELTDGRDGYPDKDWFYGAYSAELNPENPSGHDDFMGYEGQGLDSYGYSRGAASGYYYSHNAYWWQHDFFVHSGVINSDNTREEGMWLRGAWYTPLYGGFDGRWVQLFDDRPTYEPTAPITPPPTCSSTAEMQCSINGGTWNPTNCTCRALCAGCQIQ
jgi:hypothetical protein